MTGRRLVILAMEIVISVTSNIAQKIAMIPNLTAIIIIIITTPILVLIMFLPAFIELKKPKDGGPRMITAEIPEVNMCIMHFIPLANIENEQKFDRSLIQKMAKVIAVLPSLEI